GAGCTQHPVAMEEIAVAEEGTDFPAIDDLLAGEQELFDLRFSVLHAFGDRCLLFGREAGERHRLSGADAEARKLCPNLLLFGSGRSELQAEVEIFEEPGLGQRPVDLREVDRWRGRWRRLLEKGRQRLSSVPALHLDDVRHVRGTEQL